ncbi:MAG: AraC family transcriptional regulator [Clostridiales bacterium]|nr:AraC family transcriptional regulator [Clostridiales bacterium]
MQGVEIVSDYFLCDKNGTRLLSMNVHHIHGPYTAELHTHHELELCCVPSGHGLYDIGSQRYDIAPGDIFLFNNTEPHGLILPDSDTLENMVIHFNPSFLWNSLSNDMDYNFLLVFFERSKSFSHRLDRTNPATERIFRLICDMGQEFEEKNLCYELLIKIKLQTIFTEIIRHYDYVDIKKPVHPLSEGDISQLNKVLEYIDSHLDSEIRLAQLADIAHVSPAYFSTLFKRFNGQSPVEYIVHKRVQRAVEYIRTTGKSLTDIAMSCGFNNSTNFYKAFRKVTGHTPAYYRRQNDPLL